MSHEMNEGMRQCLAACEECRRACLEAFAHCLSMGGKHASRENITLLVDCAEACALAAGFLGRGSNLHGATCGACAEVCEQCAESCAAIGGDDATMRQCADACRRCAESRHEMAAG